MMHYLFFLLKTLNHFNALVFQDNFEVNHSDYWEAFNLDAERIPFDGSMVIHIKNPRGSGDFGSFGLYGVYNSIRALGLSEFAIEISVFALDDTSISTPDIFLGIDEGSGYVSIFQYDESIYGIRSDISGSDIATNLNTWYRMKLEVADGRLKFYVNDILAGDAEFSFTSANSIYLSIAPDAEFYLDNVRLINLGR